MSKRYIDADALIKELEHCSYETWSKGVRREWWAHTVKVKDNMVQCIQRQPTADVVEVVRCRDCMYCADESWCGYHSSVCSPNDYCSLGERKAEK